MAKRDSHSSGSMLGKEGPASQVNLLQALAGPYFLQEIEVQRILEVGFSREEVRLRELDHIRTSLVVLGLRLPCGYACDEACEYPV